MSKHKSAHAGIARNPRSLRSSAVETSARLMGAVVGIGRLMVEQINTSDNLCQLRRINRVRALGI